MTGVVFEVAVLSLAGAVGAVVAGIMARVLRRCGRSRPAVDDGVAEPVESSLPRSLERAGRVEEVTLLLSDIRGFTRLSERLSPADTVALVNAYLDAVCPPVLGSGGVIDKFMGDGVLAFFEGGGHASRALAAARHILASIDRARFPGGEKVSVGIALHSGDVLVGTVGPRTRREYTIISDAVNTVSRLEELNKVYASTVVASAQTMAEVGEADRAGFEGPLDVTLRGREAPVAVHVLRRPS